MFTLNFSPPDRRTEGQRRVITESQRRVITEKREGRAEASGRAAADKPGGLRRDRRVTSASVT